MPAYDHEGNQLGFSLVLELGVYTSEDSVRNAGALVSNLVNMQFEADAAVKH